MRRERKLANNVIIVIIIIIIIVIIIFYINIISTNNSQCRFFTVYQVQLTLMYYLYVSCVFSMYFIFRF